MFLRQECLLWVALVALLAAVAPSDGSDLPQDLTASAGGSIAARIVENLDAQALREILEEVLSRNPGLAAAEARARAAGLRAPQARALPDPVVNLAAFAASPETRTGPQRLSVGFSQQLPGLGKLALREQVALHGAAVVRSEVEAQRLKLITEARHLYYEIGLQVRLREISERSRAHLVHHEEVSRSRYSSGGGSAQDVVKLQAEITRVDVDLLDIEARWVSLTARLNLLRNQTKGDPLQAERSPTPDFVLNAQALRKIALRLRPELTAADARIARARVLTRLAEKGRRPNFKIGLSYTFVDPRDDAPGRLLPPEGNGDDIIEFQGGITLPVWRKSLTAGVEEAIEHQNATEEAKRHLVNEIEAAVGDLTQGASLARRQIRLVEDLLIVQAEEALDSARAGYIVGTLNALDLLHAVHMVFEAHTAMARAEFDYLVALAQLEAAVGGSLSTITTRERAEP
ncbi:MAG: TolC family protein [Acidobacteriota bacterium]|nr:TolC family protein [Acidobacteriota bacterium]